MKYEELKEKYSLPSYDELNFEFELDKEAKFLLRDIRRKMNTKVNAFLDILEGILQPEASSLSQMYEINFITENGKQKALDFYKKLMKISRFSDEIAITLDEKDEAEFIKNVFAEWNDIKSVMISIIQKMKLSWEKEIQPTEDMRYMG